MQKSNDIIMNIVNINSEPFQRPDLMRKIHLNAGVITQEICIGLHICYAELE